MAPALREDKECNLATTTKSWSVPYVNPCGCILDSTACHVVHTVISLTNEIKDMSKFNLIQGLIHPTDLSGRTT